MASYKVEIVRSAEKELRKVPPPDLKRIVRRIASLEKEPRPDGCKKLAGAAGFRIRQGNRRVIYTVDDTDRVVTILKIGNRRDVYR